MDSCSFSPYLKIDIQEPNIEFFWQKYDGTNWIDIAASKNKTTITNLEEKKYRIRLYQKVNPANEVYTKSGKYTIAEKFDVAKRVWYKSYFE